MKWAAGASVVLSLSVGAPAVAASKPWCAPNRPANTAYAMIKSELKSEGSYLSPRVIRHIANAQCGDDHKEELEAHKAALKKASGLDDAELEELFAMEADQVVAAQLPVAYCGAFGADPKTTPARVYAAKSALHKFLCSVPTDAAPRYDWVDNPAVHDAQFLRGCPDRIVGLSQLGNPTYLVDFAECNLVERRLDAKKFQEELAAATDVPRYLQLRGKIRFHNARIRFAELRAQFEKKAGEDELLKAALFDLPAKAAADFLAEHARNAEWYDKAFELMSNTDVNKVLVKHKGCGDAVRAELQKILSERKPATQDALRTLFAERPVSMLGSALLVCDGGVDGREPLAALFSKNVQSGLTLWGPRVVARQASARHLVEHKDEVPSIERLSPGSHFGGSFDFRTGGSTQYEKGIIATVAPDADGKVKVTFKQETFKEPIWDCKETDKVDRIDERGRVIYRERCTMKGHEDVTFQVKPVTVEARYATALKPGRYAVVLSFPDRAALPALVFDTPNRGQLFGVAGFGW